VKRILFTSDLHLGLCTDEISRTDEIVAVMMHIARHAVKKRVDCVVVGGDVFDCNTPSDYLIAKFIRFLNVLKKRDIRVFVFPGNHDAIAREGRRSCLEFLHKLKVGYPNLRLIDDVKTIRMWKEFECGRVYFTFLPFLYRSHIDKHYKSVQQYVDSKARATKDVIRNTDQHYVFSHLAVEGVTPGAEAVMLKKVETVVPQFFTKWRIHRKHPIIIQAHNHSRQEIGNINIVGSPVFTDFGEKEKHKYFLEIRIPESMDDRGSGLFYHEVPCHPFVEWDWNADEKPFEVGLIKKRAKKLPPNCVLKINLQASEGISNSLQVEEARQVLSRYCFHVKKIRPRIIRSHVKRNSKQTISLDPKGAVKLWLRTNRPKRAKRIWKLAKQYLEME
jgi:exonuclease SbcD